MVKGMRDEGGNGGNYADHEKIRKGTPTEPMATLIPWKVLVEHEHTAWRRGAMRIVDLSCKESDSLTCSRGDQNHRSWWTFFFFACGLLTEMLIFNILKKFYFNVFLIKNSYSPQNPGAFSDSKTVKALFNVTFDFKVIIQDKFMASIFL